MGMTTSTVPGGGGAAPPPPKQWWEYATDIGRGIADVATGGATEAIYQGENLTAQANQQANTRQSEPYHDAPATPANPNAQVLRAAPTASDPHAVAPGTLSFGTSTPPGAVPASGGSTVGNTGVKSFDVNTSAPGLGGFFGEHEDYPIFTTDVRTDPNYQSNRDMVTAGAAAAGSRPDVRFDTSPQGQFRSREMGLADYLGRVARGEGGPSPAELQLNRATDRNMGQALSLALSARGGNQIAALKQAGDQRALISQDAGSQAAELRAHEQQAAQQALGQVLASGRGGDINLASADLQGQMQQQAQRDQMVQYYVSQGLSLDQAKELAAVQQGQFNEGTLAQQVAGAHGVSVQNSAQGVQLAGGLIGAIGSGVAGLIPRGK